FLQEHNTSNNSNSAIHKEAPRTTTYQRLRQIDKAKETPQMIKDDGTGKYEMETQQLYQRKFQIQAPNMKWQPNNYTTIK
ncbi:1130_t:CDS:2, partial [Gigaspora rosea]